MVTRRESVSVFRCLPSHLLIITNYVIFTADINYRDPYRHAIRELERYTSPKKETPQMQRWLVTFCILVIMIHLCPTYSALLTRVHSENTMFTWLNGSKITNKHEVQSEGWSVYSKITWKKKTRSNLVIYTFLFYKIQMIYHQCCQWFTCKRCDFEIQGALA